MIFAISIFVASILLGVLLAYLFVQYFQKKNLGNYPVNPSKSNPDLRRPSKSKKKQAMK